MILHLGKSDQQQNMIRLKEKTNMLIVQNSELSSWKFSVISVVSHKVENIENANQVKGRKKTIPSKSLWQCFTSEFQYCQEQQMFGTLHNIKIELSTWLPISVLHISHATLHSDMFSKLIWSFICFFHILKILPEIFNS